MFQKDKKAIESLKRLSGSVLQVFEVFSQKPIQSIKNLQEQLALAVPTIYRALEALQTLGIIQETTGKAKHKIWVYGAYVDLLNQGLEMP
ncbi:MAG: hypothetical protein R2880_02930 [Deinococcales bacterium]